MSYHSAGKRLASHDSWAHLHRKKKVPRWRRSCEKCNLDALLFCSPYNTLISTNDETSGHCRRIDFSFKIHTPSHTRHTVSLQQFLVLHLSFLPLVYSRLTIAATAGKDREWLEFPFTRPRHVTQTFVTGLVL